jgi:hypothetical protein
MKVARHFNRGLRDAARRLTNITHMPTRLETYRTSAMWNSH